MSSLQNLFVAKLPRNLTDNDLEQIFSLYEPESAKIMLDATTGKSKGFGFVLFDSVEKGEKAYKALNRMHVTLHGHSFNLAIFPSKHDGKVAAEVSNCLYIRNIPKQLSQMEVDRFLRTFGNLTYCAMREDHYGSPVWVVYAEYENVEDAKNALSKLHGNRSYFDYSPAAVLAKFADSEEAKRERRRRREGQVGNGNNGNAAHHNGTAQPHARGPAHNHHGQPHHAHGHPAPPPHDDHNGSNGAFHGHHNGAPPPGLAGVGHHHSNNNHHHNPPPPLPPHQQGMMPLQGTPSPSYSGHFGDGNSSLTNSGFMNHNQDVYMSASNENSHHGTPQPMADGVAAPPPDAMAAQQQQHALAPGASVAGRPHRFAPGKRGGLTRVTSMPSGSFDSGAVGAFGSAPAPGVAMPAPNNGNGRMSEGPAPAPPAPPGSTPECGGGAELTPSFNGNLSMPGQGGAAGTNHNPTPLSSFLNVTFPTTQQNFEPSSNGRGTPLTPLTFNFDPESEAQTAVGDGSFRERTPNRTTSALSCRSITGGNGSTVRYRHNPYAPVTPMSSAPSSPGPSTPRVTAVTYGTAGGHQTQPRTPDHSMSTHFGHATANGGHVTGGHFSSSCANGYLSAPNVREPPQQLHP